MKLLVWLFNAGLLLLVLYWAMGDRLLNKSADLPCCPHSGPMPIGGCDSTASTEVSEKREDGNFNVIVTYKKGCEPPGAWKQ